MRLPRRAVTQSEASFQKAVIAMATLFGWRVYHVPDSRRVTSAGFPDLVMAKPGRLVCAELKRAGQKPREDQVWWLERFREAGVDAFVWTERDWDEIETVLRGGG